MSLKIALAQLSSTAGALEANAAAVLEAALRAEANGADVLLTPEMFISGYPVEDLLGEESFLDAIEIVIEGLLTELPKGLTVLLGAPVRNTFLPEDSMGRLFGQMTLDSTVRTVRNALLVIRDGSIVDARSKVYLPTTSVFDDSRWTLPGSTDQGPVVINGHRVGLLICEDFWNPQLASSLRRQGAELLLVANASPYTTSKIQQRFEVARTTYDMTKIPVVYLNTVGGQDELVFDGSSFVLNGEDPVLIAPSFRDEIVYVEHTSGGLIYQETYPVPDSLEATYKALVLGLRDYVSKNGFSKVVLGLSGGLDSALAAVLAVDALGPQALLGVGMPGPYSSDHSVTDAEALANNLGVEFRLLPIKATYEAELELLGDLLHGPGEAVARENIQARLRALHLMTLANTRNAMLINTGNRSEAAVGYFTLGGDSSGGFAPLKDVPKTLVYALTEWRNVQTSWFPFAPIPRNTIDKPPSAELAPDQVDSNTLPPYPLLDAILEAYLERSQGVSGIVGELMASSSGIAQNLDEEGATALVQRVLTMVDRAEHKRRQVAPGVKITARSFGRDRRVPITNHRTHSALARSLDAQV